MFTVLEQAKANADLAVAFGLGTWAAQGTLGAVKAFIDASIGFIAIIGGVA